jgi:hypothetical protein
MIATSDMVGAYAPPAVHSPDTSAICGQKYELNFHKVGAVMAMLWIRNDFFLIRIRILRWFRIQIRIRLRVLFRILEKNFF